MYLEPLTTFVFLVLYSISLLVAYQRGSHYMKQRYSNLINRLHRQYVTEINRASNLLDSLNDAEKNSYWD